MIISEIRIIVCIILSLIFIFYFIMCFWVGLWDQGSLFVFYYDVCFLGIPLLYKDNDPYVVIEIYFHFMFVVFGFYDNIWDSFHILSHMMIFYFVCVVCDYLS